MLNINTIEDNEFMYKVSEDAYTIVFHLGESKQDSFGHIYKYFNDHTWEITIYVTANGLPKTYTISYLDDLVFNLNTTLWIHNKELMTLPIAVYKNDWDVKLNKLAQDCNQLYQDNNSNQHNLSINKISSNSKLKDICSVIDSLY